MPPMPAAPHVRLSLRRATEEVHERLHGARPFAAIAERRLDRDRYAALLGALHGFHDQLERSCGAAWGDAPRSPDRVAQLEADLDHLGRRPAKRETAWTPPAGGEAALGCLYVAQGSTLGGRVIHRQLDYLLAGAAGRRFFAGSPEDGGRWRALCGLLEHARSSPARLEAMVAGAQAAFALFETCLDDVDD